VENEDQTVVQQVLSLGEERMGDVVNQLLANESFVSAMQTAITQGLAAKRSVDSTVGTVLGAVNVPTLDDVDDVRSKLLELEDVLAEVEVRAKRISKRVAGMAETEEKEAAPKKAKKAKKKKASATTAAQKKPSKKKK